MSRGILGKPQLEKALYEENKEISSGRLKEENPLDTSIEFRKFCEACRRGDLKVCQEQISTGININARDEYDYTPLILVSSHDNCRSRELMEEGLIADEARGFALWAL